ncbi:hypothetical protein ABVT39_026846 [Epinephelus coioides]
MGATNQNLTLSPATRPSSSLTVPDDIGSLGIIYKLPTPEELVPVKKGYSLLKCPCLDES